MNDKYISSEEIENLGGILFRKIGVPRRIYKPVVNTLITTSLRGVDSHGIRLIPHYVRAALIGRINKNPKFVFKKTASSTGIFDADHGFGIAAGIKAMGEAVKLARKTGIGSIAVKNSSHFGAAATYSLLAANNNMIGLSFTNVDSLVLPYGGKKKFLGTNPICFAAPCEGEDPFCLDMATTQISWNKLLIYKSEGKKLERGWAADRKGNSVEDPMSAVSLLPIASYKGYGLGFMVEILSSLLTGMPFGPNINPMYPLNKKKRNLGQFFVAIDIARFEDINVFKKRLKQLMNELRASPPASGFGRVMVPGDPEKESYKFRLKKGIPVPYHDIQAFAQLINELKIKNSFRSFS